MLMNLRNALMTGKRLPYDAELEYLESTGTQYIDTGVYPTQLAKAEVDLQFTALVKSSVLGSNNGASQDTGWNNLFGVNETGIYTRFFWCQWGTFVDGNFPKDTERHLHIFARDGNTSWTYKIDAYTVVVTTGIRTQSPPIAMYLFACNNDGVVYRQAHAKIFKCQIWDSNSTLVRDFIPVRVGNVGYMYDRVTRKLFGNAGTGAFTYGNDLKYPIPAA